MNSELLDYKEFIEHILIIQDKIKRQNIYFDQIKDLVVFY